MNKEANKMDQIQTQLHHIQKTHWMPTLKQLIHNYDGAISDTRHNIIDGILEVLNSLNPNDKNNDTLGIMRLQKMFCFNYRFYKGIPATYWDPTAESFADFSEGEKVSVYEGYNSHPAPDILMRWIAEHFNQAKVLN